MEHFTKKQAREFAEKWLPAWSGNRPADLISFYAADAFYADPAVPDGLQGREKILPYFEKLLAKNPNWIWRQLDAVPLENGFLNKWEAEIPVGGQMVICRGVCTVQLRQGLIVRNEVFFDRSPLLFSKRS